MIKASLKQIADVLKEAQFKHNANFTGISVDTKTLEPGNLFITWKGEKHDGHDFVHDAETKGATALIVEKPVDTKLPFLIVPDALKALGEIAAYYRQQFNLPLIAVTGSNGKTTIKNILANIFHYHFNEDDSAYLVSEKSYNNHVGVPLTLFKLNDHHKMVIAEMGMNHFGEISYITNIARPDIALINNAFTAHLAGLDGTLQGVAKAKGEVFEGLKKSGIAVLNADSEFYDYWKTLSADFCQLSFGIYSHADVVADHIHLTADHSIFRLKTPVGNIDIRLPLMGQHNVMNALAAATVAIAAGVSLETIKRGLRSVISTDRRLQIHHLASGAVLVDDGYNANPASTRAAIEVLKEMPGKKIMIFGDMRELGSEEAKFHRDIGEYAKTAGIDQMFAIGELTKESIAAFGGDAEHFDDKSQLLSALQPYLKQGSVFLVKGSFSMDMKWFVDQLLHVSN